MKIIVVKGYKVERDLVRRPRPEEASMEAEYGANDVYDFDVGNLGDSEIEKTIHKAIVDSGYTEADVISITMVPWQTNGRDRGSNDYHIFLRDKE